MTTRILLIRHGQTEWNSAGRFMGQQDIPLNATGQQQAQALAERLSDERPQAIYASALQRAWQTAAEIHSAIHTAAGADGDADPGAEASLPALIAEPRLREMNFGAWEGCTYAELQTSQPQVLAAWEADLLHVAPPGGESLLQMAGRVQSAYQDIVAAHPDGTAILVAHGGPLQMLTAHIFGLSWERYWQFHLNNTGWVELSLYPSGAVLNRFNDIAHLDKQKLGGRRWPPGP